MIWKVIVVIEKKSRSEIKATVEVDDSGGLNTAGVLVRAEEVARNMARNLVWDDREVEAQFSIIGSSFVTPRWPGREKQEDKK